MSAPFLVMFGTAIGSIYVSLRFLSWSGMSLARSKESAPIGVSSPQVDGDSHPRPDRSTRWVTAIFVAVAIICSVAVTSIERWRASVIDERERLVALAESLDGEIETPHEENHVISIELGAPATDKDLDQFRKCRHVESIDLSDSQVTDLGLKNLSRYFPKTEKLRLNNTDITDNGLVALNELPFLWGLDLDDTDIDGAGFAQVQMKAALHWLSLNNTPFNDSGCQQLARFPNLKILSLVGTRVTDQGLSHLTTVTQLSLGHTAVKGHGLSDLTQLKYLKLNGTKVDDSTFSVIAKLEHIDYLDLSDTVITDVALAQLQTMPEGSTLTLDRTFVTGRGFQDWSPESSFMILSLIQTPFNDAGVKHLRKLSKFQYLDLSGTQISDACLKDLAQMTIKFLTLHDTKITPEGLLAESSGWLSIEHLRFAPGQFNESEVEQLMAQFPGKFQFIDLLAGDDDE